MGDIDQSSNKTFGKKIDSNKNKDIEYPIKKLHLLEEKHFIVIDRSIAQRLSFFDPENTELYFQQELTEDDCIILRPFKMRE